MTLGPNRAIRVFEEIISQSEDSIKWMNGDAVKAVAATATQLCSCKVSQRKRYGYISTGQDYVFLRIGDDPSKVHFALHIPNRCFDRDDPYLLHQTAVAQIFAFILQAAPEARPTQEWRQNPWARNLHYVLRDMPDSIRTNTIDSDYIQGRFATYVSISHPD
ncbi:hypothetical protein MRB53_038354 [Persea americana]|nr:hypothetical protein MRB53_038354 [Persea americana]